VTASVHYYTCSVCFAIIKQEAQLMMTNPRDAFRGQSRSPNIVPFHMLGIVSSCAIVTVFRTRRFFDIRLQNVVTLKSGSVVTQDHWKWYHSIDCYDFLLVFFSNFVPKTHRFWDIRRQSAVTLKTGLGVRQGHWRYYRSSEPIRLPIDV